MGEAIAEVRIEELSAQASFKQRLGTVGRYGDGGSGLPARVERGRGQG